MNTHRREMGVQAVGETGQLYLFLSRGWHVLQKVITASTLRLAATAALCSSSAFLGWLGQVWSRNGVSKPLFKAFVFNTFFFFFFTF